LFSLTAGVLPGREPVATCSASLARLRRL
jgi:hypothetical protein